MCESVESRGTEEERKGKRKDKKSATIEDTERVEKETKRKPRGNQKEPKRKPKGHQKDTKRKPKGSQKEAKKEAKRKPKGSQKGSHK